MSITAEVTEGEVSAVLTALERTRAEYLSRKWACNQCGAVHTTGERFQGRGRHLSEHPEHVYLPCGHSYTWFGARPVDTPAPAPRSWDDPFGTPEPVR